MVEIGGRARMRLGISARGNVELARDTTLRLDTANDFKAPTSFSAKARGDAPILKRGKMHRSVHINARSSPAANREGGAMPCAITFSVFADLWRKVRKAKTGNKVK